MPIELTCPSCSQTLRVGDEHAGRKARCPQCRTVFDVPLSGLAGSAERSAAAWSAQDGVKWYAKTTDGQRFGPIEKTELDSWVAEGRITADCQLLEEGGSQWQWASDVYPSLTPDGGMREPAMAAMPGTAGANPYATPGTPGSATSAYRRPHRGELILILGILGLIFTCPLLGIPAWVMGQSDLTDMKHGRMDNTGHGMTVAGMVLGIISTALVVLFCGGFFLAVIAG
jgi:hypothetical protein